MCSASLAGHHKPKLWGIHGHDLTQDVSMYIPELGSILKEVIEDKVACK